MKKFHVSLAILALALVLGLAFIGCKNDVEDDPLNGTYVGNEDDTKLILNNGNWNLESVDGNRRGTYTANEGIITFTITDFYIPPEWAVEANTTAGWKNKSEYTEILKGFGMTDAQINEGFAPITGTYTGNIISFGGGGDFTRQ